jgi:hypothetical protein
MNQLPRLQRGSEGGPLMALFCLVVGGVVTAISVSLFQWETQTGGELALKSAALAALLILFLLSGHHLGFVRSKVD